MSLFENFPFTSKEKRKCEVVHPCHEMNLDWLLEAIKEAAKNIVGISSIRQTVFSSESGGKNVLTVTLTNGNSTDFTVRNGERGKPGAGYTLTESDKREIVDAVLALLDSETPVENPDGEARTRFVEAMREKAAKLGLDIKISGAAGYPDSNTSTGKSMVKLYTIANGYDELAKIWNTKNKTITTRDVVKTIDLKSSVYTDDSSHFASELTDSYFIFGGKTGTGGGNRLLGVIAEAPNGRQFAAWLSAKNRPETSENNRHKCMKYLLDIAWALAEDPNADISLTEARMIGLGVVSAAAILLPQAPDLFNYERFDFFKTVPVSEFLTLDSIAWGGKTYRDIFLNSNIFADVSSITSADNSGWSAFGSVPTPTLTTEQYYTPPNSWNCSGNTSVQMYKNMSLTGGPYFMGCKRKLTSYKNGGWLGMQVYYIGGAGLVISDTVSESDISQDFQTVSHIFTPKTDKTQFWIGSGGSADLAGFVDGVVCINMEELFGANLPSKAEMTTLYDNFLRLYKGEQIPAIAEKYKYENPVYTYNADTVVDIASNIKVLTAITALDYAEDLEAFITIKASDIQPGSGPVFSGGERLTLREALYALMLPSSNTCAYAIARYIGNKLLNLED